MLSIVTIAAVHAAPAYELWDAGDSLAGRAALVVVTPGVQPTAYLTWVNALEKQGVDAWLIRFPAQSQGVEEIVSALKQGHAELASTRETVVAAHGLGGVFVLLAELPGRLALVGTPLGAHPVPLSLGELPRVVAEELPLPPPLIGALPMQPYSAELALAYRQWTRDFPTVAAPEGPTLLIASGSDVLAPPEVVRLPSAGWSQRTWERTGRLGLDLGELDHAMLLSDPRLAHRVARYLAR